MRADIKNLKIGIVIPDRGDRPEFMANCIRLIHNQTILREGVMNNKAEFIKVDYPPVSDAVDITPRYKFGYDYMRNKGLDVIAFMENDDWYKENYLEYMLGQWIDYNRPVLFGTQYTIYYHIRLGRYFIYHHLDRASMMNTLIKPDLDVPWPPDIEPFTDAHIWFNMKGWVTFKPDQDYSIGIKHGIGKCGGPSHIDRLHRYNINDNGFLQKTVDQESFEFYNKFLGT